MNSEQAISIIESGENSIDDVVVEDAETIAKAAEALDALRETLTSDAGFMVCHSFLGRTRSRKSSDQWRRVRFNPELERSFRSALTDRLRDSLPVNTDLVPYNHEDPTSEQVPIFVREDFAELAGWLDNVPSADWPSTFDGSEDFLGEVDVHVAVLMSAEDTLKAFRRRTASTLTRRNGFLASLTGSKNELEPVKGKVFEFPTEVDFLEWRGFVYVLRLSPLESLTKIREVTNARARAALDLLGKVDGLQIEGLSEVAVALSDRPATAKRLASAARNKTISSLQPKALRQHIANYELPLTVRRREGKLVVSFDVTNPKHIDEFVNLVADIYLRSTLTSLDYKARSKQLVRRSR